MNQITAGVVQYKVLYMYEGEEIIEETQSSFRSADELLEAVSVNTLTSIGHDYGAKDVWVSNIFSM